jgi:selenocysteine lyase/cysteine desulfurase
LTCRIWTRIFSRFPVIKCSRRPAAAFYTANENGSTKCRRIKRRRNDSHRQFRENDVRADTGKVEAGTPAIAANIGLGAAIDYLNSIDFAAAARYEHELLEYATEKLSAIEGVRIIGTAREKASVLSFTVENVHPHDIGTILDQSGIAIRAGHHCAQPVMQFFRRSGDGSRFICFL